MKNIMMLPCFPVNGTSVCAAPFAGGTISDADFTDQLADEMLNHTQGMTLDSEGVLHIGSANGTSVTTDPFAGVTVSDADFTDQLADEMLNHTQGMTLDSEGVLHIGSANGTSVTTDPFAGDLVLDTSIEEAVQDANFWLDADGIAHHTNTLTGEVNSTTVTPDPFAAIPSPPTGHSDQWYHKNPDLFRAEVAAMMQRHPKAKLHFMPTSGDMCWLIELKLGKKITKTPWQFMLRYMKDHPNNRNYGGSIRVVLLKQPTIEEVRKRAREAGRPGVPHLLSGKNEDGSTYTYLCTRVTRGVKDGREAVSSAVQVASWAADWAAHFELALKYDDVWNDWCNDAHFSDWMVDNPRPRARS